MKSYKLTRKQKAAVLKWLERLRNKNSRQAKNLLKTKSGYCCLGHACVALGRKFKWNRNTGVSECEESEDILPESVAKEMGVDQIPTVRIGEHNLTLIDLNDVRGFSLSEIADVVEADWIKGKPLKTHKKL